MSRFTTHRASVSILTLLLVLGSLVGIYRALAEDGSEVLPRLNDDVLVAPSPQAVTAADFYTVTRVRACSSGTCNHGPVSLFCNSGDELTGFHAWKQSVSDGGPLVLLTSKAVGNRGAQALMNGITDAQRAFLRLFCANTTP